MGKLTAAEVDEWVISRIWGWRQMVHFCGIQRTFFRLSITAVSVRGKKFCSVIGPNR